MGGGWSPLPMAPRLRAPSSPDPETAGLHGEVIKTFVQEVRVHFGVGEVEVFLYPMSEVLVGPRGDARYTRPNGARTDSSAWSRSAAVAEHIVGRFPDEAALYLHAADAANSASAEYWHTTGGLAGPLMRQR